MQIHFKSFRWGIEARAGLATLLVGWGAIHASQQAAAQQAVTGSAAGESAPALGGSVGDAALADILQPIRQKFSLPAMATAIVTGKGLSRVAAVGVLKRGSPVPVRLDCLWHLGSDSKAMTSTLIARLVERHLLRWDMTLGQVFPELAAGMHPAFRAVSLLQLLSHRAGLPPNLDYGRFATDDVRALRLRAVQEETAKPPVNEPGSTLLYSNLGYILAGAVVEKITGQTWEQAITKELFAPLHMNSAGFGGTGTPGQIDQPWPHGSDGTPAGENGPGADNPPVLGPAGRVHATIQDWALFVQDQLRGDRGEPALLSPESYQRLHTPPFGGDYALGWICADRSWAGGRAFNHVGDNTMNCANVWLAPHRNFAILVCTNEGGTEAFKATDAAMAALIKLLPASP